MSAYTSGHFKDAVDYFLAADRLSPSAPLSFNIARAYEKLEDDSGALRWYRDYLRRSPHAPNLQAVTAVIESLEGRLARKGVQQVTILSKPLGATVSIDDTTMGITPGTFDLPPGHHKVLLTRRGYADATSEFELAPDRARDLALTLTPALPAPTAPPAAAATPAVPPLPSPAPVPERPTASRSRATFGAWSWVALGAGAATLGGALTFELLRADAEHDAETDPTQIGYKQKLDSMESRRTTARVLAGVGGVLVLAGGVMLAVDLAGSRSRPTAALIIAPRSDGGVATSFSGSF